jgi:hypothetical protein
MVNVRRLAAVDLFAQAIDQNATKRLTRAIAFPRSQRRHFHNWSQALQNVVAHSTEGAPKVRSRLPHVQQTRRMGSPNVLTAPFVFLDVHQ